MRSSIMPWHSPKSPNRSARWLAAFAIALVGASPALAEQSFDCVIDPAETVKLGSPLTGVLAEIKVKRGDTVTRGQPVALLESVIEVATVKLNRFKAESTAKVDA